MSAKPAKIPMTLKEFYDVRSRKRVKCSLEDIDIKVIDGSKYRDGNPRFQAVGNYAPAGGGDEYKVYKFVSRDNAHKLGYESE